MASNWQGICLWAAVLLSLASVCHAQSTPVTPEDEFKQKIRVSQDIQPLGEKPFGENINLYNGSVSFTQTDVDAPGNGPDLLLTRTYTLADLPATQYYVGIANSVLADWTLNVPRIETLSARDLTLSGQWFFLDDVQRCTHFYQAVDITVQQTPSSTPVEYEPNEWWHGYQMITADGASQDLLKRDPQNTLSPTMGSMTFPIVTKQNWMISCLAQTANGQPGEGFLALAPDGTRYWFDWLAYKDAPAMVKGQGAALLRRTAMMLASRIEDRFGNSLTYAYDALGNPTSITANDGRKLTLSYQSPSGVARLVSTTLQPAGGAPRTWTYSYGTPALSQVQLPDGTSWGFDFPIMTTYSNELFDYLGGCQEILKRVGSSRDFTVRHPSGLQGIFTVTNILRGRSYVPGTCSLANPRNPKTLIPDAYSVQAVTKKVLSGAGLASGTWTFVYSPANESAIEDCASGCASTVWTDVTNPEGKATRHTFSNRFDASESLLLQTDYYAGAVGSALLRREQTRYAAPGAGPWPSVYGSTLQMYLNAAQTEQLSPLEERTISQDGDTYTWQAESFNEFAQITKTKRSNSIVEDALEEQTSYLNDLPHWVLGLPLQVTNVTNASSPEVESTNTYDLTDVTLQSRARFGQTLMHYTFNSAGQLFTFIDGKGNQTKLENYKRGIPQTITYPDTHTQSLTVDDFGQITSITDQAGSTTSYSYDAVGRLKQITYPSGDEQAWYPTAFAYDYVTAAERGIGAGHWRRTVSKGNARAVTYFDALLRPVLSDSYSMTDGASHTSARTDYDWKGQTTFASYPVAGSPSLAAITSGTTSTYDALGRLTQVQQAAEAPLNTVTSTTAYLSGARKQVTDPKGNVTTTSYQVFDQPSYDAVTKVQAPENVTQVITRDLYGNPLSIRQSGLYATQSVDVTKTLTYDSYHRLCRTSEPESGSAVMAYDNANNLAWSAEGLAITGTGCGQEQVTTGKTTRTYDAMNRLWELTPPAGTQGTVYTYDALGNPKTAESGISTWSATYNKRGQLTGESLQVGSQSAWAIGYAHDAYGSVSLVHYPDGENVSYAPDALGRATKVGSYASNITYYPDGQVAHFDYGNGAAYVMVRSVRQLVSDFSYVMGSVTQLSEVLTYDANGNITKINDWTNDLSDGPRTKIFDYDALNRLSSAQANGLWGTESYTYDPLNNLRTRVTGGQTLTYNYNTLNQLVSISGGTGSTFVYDNRGNVINKNGANLVFDQKNQLTQIPGYGAYAYDAAGRRVMKTPVGGGSPTYYFYNQAGQLLYQVDGATSKTTNFVYLGRKLIARNVTVPPQIPAVPALSVATTSPDGNYSVSWTSMSGATSYTLQEQVNGGSWSTRQSGGAVSWAASGKGNGSYGYRVQACSTDGCSAWSATHSITVLLPPATPASITVPATSTGSIAVSWAASATATSYTLQQRLGAGSWGTVYTGAAASSTHSVTASGSYTYQVQACNASGCSAFKASSAVAVTVPPASAPSLSVPASSGSGSYTVSWSAVTGATSYTMQEQVNGGSWATIQASSATSKALSGKSNGTYGYRVQGCNGGGCGPWSSTGTITVALVPAVPTGAYVENYMTTKVEGNRAHWNAVTGATRYEVIRNDTGASVYSGTDTTFIIGTAFIPAVPLYYHFSVRACNAAGCSDWAVGS
jgi:YD repeat-containing protein